MSMIGSCSRIRPSVRSRIWRPVLSVAIVIHLATRSLPGRATAGQGD